MSDKDEGNYSRYETGDTSEKPTLGQATLASGSSSMLIFPPLTTVNVVGEVQKWLRADPR